MPTYAYRCDACGHANDEWLKVSEATAERTCPSCGQAQYRKQLTAPAFQLKGSGWYVTDFRDKGGKAPASADAKTDAADTAKSDAAKPDTAKAEPAKTDAAKPEAPKPDAPKKDSGPGAGGGTPKAAAA